MALIGPGGRPIAASPKTESISAPSAYIKDSGLETFAADVIEASREVPVIVDFWAPWCGPCKTLGPMIEKIVNEAKGAVRLVKVNIDENQEIARQLRIQSIPTVYAFKNGQPVDGFMGAIPETQIRDFVKNLTSGAAGHDRQAARRPRPVQRGDGQRAIGHRRGGLRPAEHAVEIVRHGRLLRKRRAGGQQTELAVELARIGVDHHPVPPPGKVERQPRLAAGGRAENEKTQIVAGFLHGPL